LGAQETLEDCGTDCAVQKLQMLFLWSDYRIKVLKKAEKLQRYYEN